MSNPAVSKLETCTAKRDCTWHKKEYINIFDFAIYRMLMADIAFLNGK